MEIVQDIADRVIILKKVELVFEGHTEDGIVYYEEIMG